MGVATMYRVGSFIKTRYHTAKRMDTLPLNKDWIEFAKIGRPHGVKGAFFLATDDRRSQWDDYKKIMIKTKDGFNPIKVEKHYVSGGELCLQVDLFKDRTQVEAHYKYPLYVHRDEINVKEDEILVADLKGLSVVSNGQTIGKVKALVNFGAQENLEIELLNGTSVWYPYLDHFVISISEKFVELEYIEEFLVPDVKT